MRVPWPVRAEPHLHPAGLILDVRECGAAEIAQLHHPAGDRDHGPIRCVDLGIRTPRLICRQQPARLLDGGVRREVDAIRRNPACREFLDLAAPLCEEIVGWHGRYLPRRDALRARDARRQSD